MDAITNPYDKAALPGIASYVCAFIAHVAVLMSNELVICMLFCDKLL